MPTDVCGDSVCSVVDWKINEYWKSGRTTRCAMNSTGLRRREASPAALVPAAQRTDTLTHLINRPLCWGQTFHSHILIHSLSHQERKVSEGEEVVSWCFPQEGWAQRARSPSSRAVWRLAVAGRLLGVWDCHINKKVYKLTICHTSLDSRQKLCKPFFYGQSFWWGEISK